MVGQKLSDYQIEKILRDFAYGVQASDAVKTAPAESRTLRAPGTVFRLYELTRKRLLEIGYFSEPADFLEWTQSSPEIRAQFAYGKTAEKIAEQADRLRGASDESVRYHLAELIFRAQNADLNPDALYLEIRTALRMTGPLNRPPRDVDLWHETHYINVCQRSIDRLRRTQSVNPEGHRSLIEGWETLIAEAQRRLRKKLRERSKSANRSGS